MVLRPEPGSAGCKTSVYLLYYLFSFSVKENDSASFLGEDLLHKVANSLGIGKKRYFYAWLPEDATETSI